jgi:hypothetical protein
MEELVQQGVKLLHCIGAAREAEDIEIADVLKAAFERGYFTLNDADTVGGKARLAKADWGPKVMDGFQRLETEVADNDASDLKSKAQDMGLWVDYVSPPGMRTILRFTIPPEE